MSKIKPDFIRTARAHRRITARLFQALVDGKSTALIAKRRERLWNLYVEQVKAQTLA